MPAFAIDVPVVPGTAGASADVGGFSPIARGFYYFGNIGDIVQIQGSADNINFAEIPGVSLVGPSQDIVSVDDGSLWVRALRVAGTSVATCQMIAQVPPSQQFQNIDALSYSLGGSLILFSSAGVSFLGSASGTPLTVLSSAVMNFAVDDETNPMIIIRDGLLGFFNQPPVVRPDVTGSRAGNSAVTGLLGAMAQLGLIIDSTTP